MADKKKACFPASPILNIFSRTFHGLVLWLVKLIDANLGKDFFRTNMHTTVSFFKNLFQTSLRDARNSVSSSVVFYDAKDVDDEEIYQEV